MIVRKIADIRELPRSAEEIRIVNVLTLRTAKLLLNRCPRVKRVILTRTARKRASEATVKYLIAKNVDVICDYAKQGRPVKFSRTDLVKMIQMRRKGFTYKEIAARVGVSPLTVLRALKGHTKFNRWSEDYNGKRKVVWMVTDGHVKKELPRSCINM